MAGVEIGLRSRAAVPAALALPTGAALLFMRDFLAPFPSQAPAVLALVYAAVLIVSIAPPDPSDVASRMHPLAVFGAGAAGVIVVWVTAERVTVPNGRLVFIVLGVAAAVAEEAWFRRLLYGWLSRIGPAVAITGCAAMFALMHYQGYGLAAMPLDFGAGLMFGWQRWASGSWLVPAATHVFANLLASM